MKGNEVLESLRYYEETGLGAIDSYEAGKLADYIEELHHRLEQALYMPLPAWRTVREKPLYHVGDDGYRGYLVCTAGTYAIGDYTTDKYGNLECFHVNGEYDPDVTHWMVLPPLPPEEDRP